MKTLCVALVLACFLASVLANHPNSFPYKGANGYPSPRRPNLPAVVDFVVVGSGPSGSALASRLSQSGAFNVMLLERGSDVSSIQMYQVPLGWEKTPVSQADRPTQIDIRSEPQVAWDSEHGRISLGFGLGGGSLINAEMFVRGNKEDYDRWAREYNATGWDFAGVLPAFKSLENNPDKYAINPDYHGIGGPLNVSQGTEFPPQDLYLAAAGDVFGTPFNPDHNGASQLTSELGTVAFHDMTVANGVRQNAYQSFIQPHLNRHNLWVVDSAHVTKINFDAHNRAVSVTWSDALNGNTPMTTRVRKEIILSAGAISTPKLLQLSGVGPAADLDILGIDVVADRPGVGANLQEHLITNLAVDNSGIPDAPWTTAADYQQWVDSKTGVYSSIGGRTVIFLRTTYQRALGDPRPDVQIIMTTPGSSIFNAMYLLRPRSRGRLVIKTNDPFVDPRPQGNFLSHPDDAKVICEGLRMGLTFFQALGPNVTLTTPPADKLFDDGACLAYLSGFAPWTNGNCNTGNHWVGTARIGDPADPMAVVDARLKVIGVNGLRVADASIMPEVTSGNTQAPSYMIGEKASTIILEDYANSH